MEITAILPGIGYFSSPPGWVDLASALQKCQANGVRVSLLVGSRESRRSDHHVRFAEARKDWNRWKASADKAKLLEQFARRYHYADPVFSTPKDFEEFCLDVDERIIGEVFSMAELKVTSNFIPVMSWIIDGHIAIFAIMHSGGRNTGFVTRDQNLIQSLRDLRPRYS